MKKLSLILLGLLTLGGCLRANKAYILDGVPVVLEYGEGPERPHMAMAAELFREEAQRYWPLTEDEELIVWRSLSEIRWSAGAVENQALYRHDEHIVYANWFSCALDVPLYSALADHYLDTQELEPTAADWEWAAQVQDDHNHAVCSSVEPSPAIQVPW